MNPVAGIALSGMTVAAAKLGASASNVANANDVSPVGGVSGYQPIAVIGVASAGGGVIGQAVTLKPASFLAYDPISPVASVQGLVQAPEIDPISEISNQIEAGHAYAFSAAALQTADDMENSLLNIET